MTVEAEIGVTHLQAKECQRLAATPGKQKERILPRERTALLIP